MKLETLVKLSIPILAISVYYLVKGDEYIKKMEKDYGEEWRQMFV